MGRPHMAARVTAQRPSRDAEILNVQAGAWPYVHPWVRLSWSGLCPIKLASSLASRTAHWTEQVTLCTMPQPVKGWREWTPQRRGRTVRGWAGTGSGTFLQTQYPHGVQCIDEREAEAKPLVKGPGYGLELVMAPGEGTVAVPCVAEGINHSLLPLVVGA